MILCFFPFHSLAEISVNKCVINNFWLGGDLKPLKETMENVRQFSDSILRGIPAGRLPRSSRCSVSPWAQSPTPLNATRRLARRQVEKKVVIKGLTRPKNSWKSRDRKSAGTRGGQSGRRRLRPKLAMTQCVGWCEMISRFICTSCRNANALVAALWKRGWHSQRSTGRVSHVVQFRGSFRQMRRLLRFSKHSTAKMIESSPRTLPVSYGGQDHLRIARSLPASWSGLGSPPVARRVLSSSFLRA